MGDTQDHGTKRRSSDDIDDSRKKAKMGGVRLDSGNGDSGYNPYLAHMRDEDAAGGADGTGAFAGVTRRQTTAKQAERIEDSDTNPFTERPHSTQYFRILESRRDLPVHKQRYAASTRQPLPFSFLSPVLILALGKSSLTSTTRPRSSSSSVRPVPERPPRSPSMSFTTSYPSSTRSSSPAPSPAESPPCPSPAVSPTRWT